PSQTPANLTTMDNPSATGSIFWLSRPAIRPMQEKQQTPSTRSASRPFRSSSNGFKAIRLHGNARFPGGFPKARLPFANRLLYSISYRHELAIRTRGAFLILGEKGMPAFDDLCRLTNETNKPFTAFCAIVALQGFGTNSVPPLLAVAANTNHPFH